MTDFEKYQQALIAEISDELRKGSSDPRLYRRRANIEYLLGMYDESISDYTMALVFDKRHSLTRYNRGLVYYKTGRIMDAINDFVTVSNQKQSHRFPTVYFTLAKLMHELGNSERAVECYVKAVRLNVDPGEFMMSIDCFE